MTMLAIDYLMGLPLTPMSVERAGRPTKSELRRWCRARSVLLNGVRVGERSAIPGWECGIWQLVFFPDNPARCCHMVQGLTPP